MNRLLPCPSCSRHVRATETACPFCAGTLAFAEAATRPVMSTTGRRLGRAALFALGTGMASACSSDPGTVVAMYGAPPTDSGVRGDAADAADAGDIPRPLYGAAPVDPGGEDDAGDPGDAG